MSVVKLLGLMITRTDINNITMIQRTTKEEVSFKTSQKGQLFSFGELPRMEQPFHDVGNFTTEKEYSGIQFFNIL